MSDILETTTTKKQRVENLIKCSGIYIRLCFKKTVKLRQNYIYEGVFNMYNKFYKHKMVLLFRLYNSFQTQIIMKTKVYNGYVNKNKSRRYM
jgi:hypothetical protein